MLETIKAGLRFIWLGLVKSILVLIGVAIGVFILCNLSNFIAHEDFLQRLTGASAVLSFYPNKSEVSVEELKALKMLIEGGHVLTQDQLLSVLTEFYNNIINGLIVVISLLGIFAYFSIRSLSRRDAEEIVEKEAVKAVEARLADVEYVTNLIQKSDSVKTLIEEMTLSEIEPRLKRTESRLMFVESLLMSSTDSGQPKKKTPKKATKLIEGDSK